MGCFHPIPGIRPLVTFENPCARNHTPSLLPLSSTPKCVYPLLVALGRRSFGSKFVARPPKLRSAGFQARFSLEGGKRHYEIGTTDRRHGYGLQLVKSLFCWLCSRLSEQATGAPTLLLVVGCRTVLADLSCGAVPTHTVTDAAGALTSSSSVALP